MKKILSISFLMVLCLLLITPVKANAAAVKLNKTTLTLNTDDSYTLKISGTTKSVKWTSSNKAVATVSTKGVVKAVKTGSTTITATVANKKYTCKVTVPTIKLNATSLTVEESNTYTLKVLGTSKAITWSTSNKAIATVTSKGVVKGIKGGTVTITAKVSNKKYTCKITVPVIKLNKTEVSIGVGKTSNLNISGSSKAVTWSSSNTAIATVTSKGVVKGIKAGKATITATVLGKKFNCTVTISDVFDAKKALAAMKVTSFDFGNGVLLTLNNTYNFPISVEATAIFYDKDGKMLETSEDYNYDFENGATCNLYFDGPYDTQYNDVSYSRYEIKYVIKPVTYVNSCYKDISFKSNIGADSVVAEVTNNGKLDPMAKLSIIYYKDGQIIDYDIEYVFFEAGGTTEYAEFYLPYDKNDQVIIPDSYKIVLDYAYTY